VLKKLAQCKESLNKLEAMQSSTVTQAFQDYLKENYKRDIVKARGIEIKYKIVEKEEIDYDSMEMESESFSSNSRYLAGNEAKEYHLNHGKYGITPDDDLIYYKSEKTQQYSIENARTSSGAEAQLRVTHYTPGRLEGHELDYKSIKASHICIRTSDNNRNKNRLQDLYAPCPGGISKGTWKQLATIPTAPPMRAEKGLPNNSSEHSEICFVRDLGATILYNNIRSEILQAAKMGKT
jgi:hypothetical protein